MCCEAVVGLVPFLQPLNEATTPMYKSKTTAVASLVRAVGIARGGADQDGQVAVQEELGVVPGSR